MNVHCRGRRGRLHVQPPHSDKICASFAILAVRRPEACAASTSSTAKAKAAGVYKGRPA
jgi:hypothetical protein